LPAAAQFKAAGGRETVLFVEDEPALRKLARKVLERLGYRVFEAGSGPEAVEIWNEHGSTIDVLVTDIVMPAGITGHDLAAKLRAERASLKVLFMSGYSGQALQEEHELEGPASFLSKPYTPQSLAEAIRRSLDGKAETPL
jgi:CheY-like chemotaxis protein